MDGEQIPRATPGHRHGWTQAQKHRRRGREAQFAALDVAINTLQFMGRPKDQTDIQLTRQLTRPMARVLAMRRFGCSVTTTAERLSVTTPAISYLLKHAKARWYGVFLPRITYSDEDQGYTQPADPSILNSLQYS